MSPGARAAQTYEPSVSEFFDLGVFFWVFWLRASAEQGVGRGGMRHGDVGSLYHLAQPLAAVDQLAQGIRGSVY